MGAAIVGERQTAADDRRRPARGHRVDAEVPAQVKAACCSPASRRGRTSVVEPAPTRDHTGARSRVRRERRAARRHSERGGGQRLRACTLTVPGDLSGAAFWACWRRPPSGSIAIEGIGLNPTRTAVLDVLRRAGADVIVEETEASATGGEPSGRITITPARRLRDQPDEVPALIGEIPALAALGSAAAARRWRAWRAELHVKESDRISALAEGLRALSAEVDSADGFRSARPLTGERGCRRRSPARDGVRGSGGRRHRPDDHRRWRRGRFIIGFFAELERLTSEQ